MSPSDARETLPLFSADQPVQLANRTEVQVEANDIPPFCKSLPPLADRRKRLRSDEVRRKPDMTQGRALEALGHALEYLSDSAYADRVTLPAISDAVKILAEKSRTVFAECPEIIPLSKRIRSRFITLW